MNIFDKLLIISSLLYTKKISKHIKLNKRYDGCVSAPGCAKGTRDACDPIQLFAKSK